MMLFDYKFLIASIPPGLTVQIDNSRTLWNVYSQSSPTHPHMIDISWFTINARCEMSTAPLPTPRIDTEVDSGNFFYPKSTRGKQ